MEWYAWVILGAVLLACELFVPTDFFLALLGFAALLVAPVAGGGLVPAPGQWIGFAVLSVLLVVFFRQQFKQRFGEAADRTKGSELVGEIATANAEIAAGAHGQVELRGTVWKARNQGNGALAPGERAEVVRVDGLCVHVVKAM